MSQHTSHRSLHHWPLQVPRLPATRQPQATETAATLAGEAQSADAVIDGELVTAPWIGLHYRSEAP